MDDDIIPTNEPIAGLIPSERFLPPKYSPVSAPKKAPIIIPKGIGLKRPTKSPIEVPIIPYLLPPKYLDPITGMK